MKLLNLNRNLFFFYFRWISLANLKIGTDRSSPSEEFQFDKFDSALSSQVQSLQINFDFFGQDFNDKNRGWHEWYLDRLASCRDIPSHEKILISGVKNP